MGDGDRATAHLSKYDITVHRTLPTDRFEHVAVAFTIESDRGHPTRIRLFEAIPTAIGIENVGFIPEYEGDRWHITDGHVIFDHWVKSDEAIHTIYAVRNVDEQKASDHLTEPNPDLDLVETKNPEPIPQPERHTRPRHSVAVKLDSGESSPAEPIAPTRHSHRSRMGRSSPSWVECSDRPQRNRGRRLPAHPRRQKRIPWPIQNNPQSNPRTRQIQARVTQLPTVRLPHPMRDSRPIAEPPIRTMPMLRSL